jgi:hypothetical protein
MGFHKRFITKDLILSDIQNLDILLSSDALFFDNWSGRFCSDLNKKERALRNKIKEDQKFLSGCPDKHPQYGELKSISEALIGLITNPTWLDIHFTKTKLGLEFPFDWGGNFEIQKEKCIQEIIKYYDMV